MLASRGATGIVVDTSPEFRLQALRAGIRGIDALLLTHAHADHIHGLDDVRPLTHERVLPVYGNGPCLAELRQRFDYVFRESQVGGGKPRLRLVEAPAGTFDLGGIAVTALPILHGELPILGWRLGDFAWLSDCSGIPDATMDLLAGVRTLAIDGLRKKPHPTHFSVGQAIEAARRVGAERTWIVHITHDHSQAELEDLCGELGSDVGARPAWDGLEIEVDG